MEFKKYRRTQIAEMRPVTKEEIKAGAIALQNRSISVSDSDIEDGCPKEGDLIARNPNKYEDRWLVNATYASSNFELIN